MLALLLGVTVASSDLMLTRANPPTIFIEADATAPERLAAKELADWLGQVLGARLTVGGRPRGTTIYVGQSKHFPEVNYSSLGDEEVLIKSRGNSLLITGGRPRGTVYAVDRFLHRLGVRWWTPWAATVPHRETISLRNLNVRENPAFESRDPFWYSAFDRDWARRNMSNSMHARLTDEDGGALRYEGFVHTFYPLVPPEKHFKEHPEWYALIDGQRKWEGAQLCTTNPELRDFVVSQVREWLKKNPRASIVSVSQNDWYGWCQCANCKALDDEQGTHAASVLALANYVGEKIEPDYPNVAIDTLAYQYTRKAPKTLRPRRNVIVRLCSIECNFAQPLTHPSNASFAQDMRDWSRLTNRLYIWDYVTDFSHYMLPFPNWYTQGPNIRFFAQNGGKGLFEEGAYQSTGASMAEMEAWVQAQLLWDPKQDDRKLIKEFLQGYYGPATKQIGTYLDVVAKAAKDVNTVIWTGPDAPFFDLDLMLKCESLFNAAEATVRNSPDLLWRVRLAHLPVRYVWLSRWRQFRTEAASRGLKWPLPESRKAVADQWLAVATGPGPKGWTPMTHMNEGGLTPQAWAARFAVDPVVVDLSGRLKAPPLPPDLRVPTGAEVVDLQDDEAKLDGEGDMAELRPDKDASDGVACWMPGSHHEWAFQMPMAKVKPGKWHVYVVARALAAGTDLPSETQMFTTGVYSADLSRGLVSKAITHGQAGEGYKGVDLGVQDLTKGCYVWVAPVNGIGVASIWVDRVLLVKQP